MTVRVHDGLKQLVHAMYTSSRLTPASYRGVPSSAPEHVEFLGSFCSPYFAFPLPVIILPTPTPFYHPP